MSAHTRTEDPSPATRSGPGSVHAISGLIVQLDALRFAAGEADVLAAITVEWFDKRQWGDVDSLQLERLAYLFGMIARASTAVVAAVDMFHGALADAQPAERGELWESEDAEG